MTNGVLELAQTAEQNLPREAHALLGDLLGANRRIYWFDLIATAATIYASLWIATTSRVPAVAIPAGVVCVLALYRAISFIHELTHLRRDQVPGFHLAWNAVIGVPFLTPSLMYEGVHLLHHAKDRYGTPRDPEYHPLSRRPLRELAAFLAIAVLAPLGVVLRFAIVAPLSLVIPPLRRLATAKMSAMTINTGFSREDFERASSPPWLAQEIACWLWSWLVAALAILRIVPVRALVITAAIYSAMAVLNQLRTAVAHVWDNPGEPMNVRDQFLDTVNVPPPALLPGLWAPVGLRYHALHHLMPRLPYHNLAAAHRRLVEALPADSDYRRVDQRELFPAVGALLKRIRTNAARA